MIDDGYIHWNLLRHMIKAGQLKLAQDLVTDLKWLAAKLKVTGPADLLNDYLSVKENVDNMVVLILSSYLSYLSSYLIFLAAGVNLANLVYVDNPGSNLV